MKQFNRFLDPKKDLGSFSGMVCLYLLVMVFVSIILTFAITLFMFGRYGLEMAEKQEYVENLINGNGISYLIICQYRCLPICPLSARLPL